MDESYQKEIKIRLTGVAWTMPDDIGAWLGRLLLLYGVPFNYLIPEEAILPPESIRFFSLDPGWMKCLLEGACSVGKSSSLDELFDQNLRNRFLDLAGEKARELRAGEKGRLNWPLTGFLLRSSLVEGWQGLEMRASGADGQGNSVDPLPALRIDRLSPDIMLCLFNGKVTKIEIKQPPEGLHFGAASETSNRGYTKQHLRRMTPAEKAGDLLEGNYRIDVPMRGRRVVDVRALAVEMENRLRPDFTGPLTSAEFAVQMVEAPGKAIFTAPPGDPS